MDDVKNAKTALEQTQKQVEEKTRQVDLKKNKLTRIEDSPEINSFRELQHQKSTLERRVKKWSLLNESRETNQTLEQFSISNSAKRSVNINNLHKLEYENIKKQYDNQKLNEYAKLLEEMLTKRR